MRLGRSSGEHMLKTRLDGRSEDNASFQIKDKEGVVLATIRILDNSSTTLEITTSDGLHIEKPNGWQSKAK